MAYKVDKKSLLFYESTMCTLSDAYGTLLYSLFVSWSFYSSLLIIRFMVFLLAK